MEYEVTPEMIAAGRGFMRGAITDWPDSWLAAIYRAMRALEPPPREGEKQVSGFSEPSDRYVKTVRDLNNSKG